MTTAIRPTRFVYALDCPDAVALAQFYAELLGWEVKRPGPDEPDAESPEWVSVVPPNVPAGGFSLGLQRIDNYRAPDWPEGPIPQQAHLDLWVASIAESEKVALALGAQRHSVQPGGDDEFVVYLDPAGHLFCLCAE